MSQCFIILPLSIADVTWWRGSLETSLAWPTHRLHNSVGSPVVSPTVADTTNWSLTTASFSLGSLLLLLLHVSVWTIVALNHWHSDQLAVLCVCNSEGLFFSLSLSLSFSSSDFPVMRDACCVKFNPLLYYSACENREAASFVLRSFVCVCSLSLFSQYGSTEWTKCFRIQ